MMADDSYKVAFAMAALALGVAMLTGKSNSPLSVPAGGNADSTAPAFQTGNYTVPDPNTGYNPYAHIPTTDWYKSMGLTDAVAAAQVAFDLADADFVAGKATLNQRDQAGVRLEIEQLKASKPGENSASLAVLENLLAYLQAHPEISRYDIRDWTSF